MMPAAINWDILHGLFVYSPGAPLIFSSGTFWVLFLLFLPVFSWTSTRSSRIPMLIFVLLFSLFFYYKSSGLFVGLLICTATADYFLARFISRNPSRTLRRAAVALSLCLSLGILGYFKYANFFLSNLGTLVGRNFQPLDLVLPVGISFYTFQSVSYIVDVYCGRVRPARSWLEYAFFLSFFPALVAGPIVRAKDFLHQIDNHRAASHADVYGGLWLIILGILKKAVVADYIAQYNDLIFDSPGVHDAFETIMAILGYTMQIYCDFSGYSDMAIGLALIMGFRLGLNFNFPYRSTNLTEFWRRWHISLSSWLRDYVYIPLGGNRKGRTRTYLNNMATMLIGGLWHGAAWKFVFWGGMHGLGLAVHKASRPFLGAWADAKVLKPLWWLLTFVFVAALWVFFRADSWESSWTILHRAVTGPWPSARGLAAFMATRWLWLLLMAAIICTHFAPEGWTLCAGLRFIEAPAWVRLVLFVIVIQLVIQFSSEEVAPFIYFQF